jgi:hypothetical protein
MPDVNIKVAVLESRLDAVEEIAKETHEMVFDIKSRLDKQNGLIPHMAEDVKALMSRFETNAISDAKSNTKLSILWSTLSAIARRRSFGYY